MRAREREKSVYGGIKKQERMSGGTERKFDLPKKAFYSYGMENCKEN